MAMHSYTDKLRWLTSQEGLNGLKSMQRGIERETLRTTNDGRISLKPHPQALGSALCHNSITTDYSEALLELITKPCHSIHHCLEELDQLHSFVHRSLDNELLWPHSMPPKIQSPNDIPIADYGSSLTGMMKHVYRRGLEVRYGRTMQSIAGIHYNVSYGDDFWRPYNTAFYPQFELRECKDTAYFSLIRRFLRDGWILNLLTGASPICHQSFTSKDKAALKQLQPHQDFYYGVNSCSLRMGDLGYHNSAQSDLFVCYDSLEQYVHSLSRALYVTNPDYEALGLYDQHQQLQQLSTHTLQIENEFYSSIRPKQITESLERPTLALERRGVAYIEFRNIDIDPLAPSGISAITSAMIEIFATSCLIDDAKLFNKQDRAETPVRHNQVAMYGRDQQQHFVQSALLQWTQMADIAQALSNAHGTDLYSQAFQLGLERLRNPDKLPSNQVLQTLISNGHQKPQNYVDYCLELARQHQHFYQEQGLSSERLLTQENLAQQSLRTQASLPDVTQEQLLKTLNTYFEDLPAQERWDCAALTD